jgi:anti-sigma B factor antagonist
LALTGSGLRTVLAVSCAPGSRSRRGTGSWRPRGVDELPETDQLIIDRRPADNGWVLGLRGELDLATAPMLNEEVGELERVGFDRLVLDLRELSFMDCAGIRVIVAADRRSHYTGAEVEILCGPGQIKRVFGLTGLDQELRISAMPTTARTGDDRPLAA